MPIQPLKRRQFAKLIKLFMLAFVGIAMRRGGRRSSAAVTAFSIATVTTRAATAAATPTPSSRPFALSSPLTFVSGRINVQRQLSTSLAMSSTLESNVVTEQRLQQALDVTHPAFDVIEKDVVTEYGAYCTLYRHRKSGAELLSVASDDENKVFGITFRTPPEDSTGVPHILEHSVLCGSRKYKTKDPFVHLLKGSLQTFLNAFTYPDRTCYVVASQNQKDFYNLINVYADAVFHPRAISDPQVHAQEGWHLELESKEDPLTYKGVVYNEMKGVYSSPDSLLMRASQQAIFPDNTYSVDSGGDPRVIPELSFEQFVDFHRKYYHPSNARIYFAGDDDVYKRLELMDEYLNEFDQLPEAREKSMIAWQAKSFKEPKYEIHYYPAGADQPETHMVMVNWLLNDKPMTAYEELTLGVLDHLLMGTTSAILRKTLMESGLGDAVTGGGVSDELLQATYSVGLKGVQPENVKAVENLVLETLSKVAKEGFSEDDIASSLNTIEFDLREFNTGSFPKGLSLMLGSMSKWIYEKSPTGVLKFEEPLAELKANLKQHGPKVFQDMVSDLLVNNSHRATVELAPSKTMEEEILKEEQQRLESIKSSLSDAELEEVIEKTKLLKELQASEDPPEARATIPSLQLADLKRETTEYPITVQENEGGTGITVVRHELGSTSGIAYVNLAVDLSVLSLDDVVWIPLFTKMMTENGAGEYDAVALSRKIGTHTGGIDINLLNTAVHPKGQEESISASGENLQTKMVLQGKATSEKIGELFSIFKLILTEANLDSKSKVIELLKESRSRLESRIQGAGHAMVNARMKARYRVGGYIEEMLGGISYLESLKVMVKQAEEDWPSVLAKLEKIRSTLLADDVCRSGMILDITGDKAVLDNIQPDVDLFLTELPGRNDGKKLPDSYETIHPWVPEAKKRMAEMVPLIDEGFVVPTQVSYVGKSGLLYEEGETIPGSAEVVSRFLKTGYLWDHVRVIGGAYGGFCTFSPFSGFFSFLSYRDPNLEKTLDVYDAAADALMAAADAMEEDPQILENAIIGTIGDKDGVKSPDQKGYTSFQRWLIGQSPEYRQKYRDEILNTKPEDFREFARRLKKIKNPSVAVVSSKTAFQEAIKAGKSFVLKDIF